MNKENIRLFKLLKEAVYTGLETPTLNTEKNKEDPSPKKKKAINFQKDHRQQLLQQWRK